MGSVALSLSSYTKVGRYSAIISCSALDWPYPSDAGTHETGDDENGSSTTISYSNTIWSWTFNDGGTASTKEPTHQFTGLTAGSRNTCRGTLSVKCTRTVTTKTWKTTTVKVPDGKDENGNTIYKDEKKKTTTTTGPTSTSYSLGSASDSIAVYTKPAEFSWGSGVATDKTIQVSDGLSASKWNTLVTRTEQRDNWKDQSGGADYGDAEVSSGELVTAAKYNILAKALGVSQVTAHTDKTTGTLIIADVFIALQTAVNA